MVEGARLESVYGSDVIQGSNPCLSAKKDCQASYVWQSLVFIIKMFARERQFIINAFTKHKLAKTKVTVTETGG